MEFEITLPRPGDRLVHRFRSGRRVTAEVLSVENDGPKVVVRVDGVEYRSLSEAAATICGQRSNGWVFWGLRRRRVAK